MNSESVIVIYEDIWEYFWSNAFVISWDKYVENVDLENCPKGSPRPRYTKGKRNNMDGL